MLDPTTASAYANLSVSEHVSAVYGPGRMGNYHRMPTVTTAERDRLTTYANVPDGLLIYNSTTGKFQGRAAGAWVDLH